MTTEKHVLFGYSQFNGEGMLKERHDSSMSFDEVVVIMRSSQLWHTCMQPQAELQGLSTSERQRTSKTGRIPRDHPHVLLSHSERIESRKDQHETKNDTDSPPAQGTLRRDGFLEIVKIFHPPAVLKARPKVACKIGQRQRTVRMTLRSKLQRGTWLPQAPPSYLHAESAC
ncbi:hypothetical protein ACEPAF_5978 [Sanghuangporus sanghuang]